jgi:hypothetical protein
VKGEGLVFVIYRSGDDIRHMSILFRRSGQNTHLARLIAYEKTHGSALSTIEMLSDSGDKLAFHPIHTKLEAAVACHWLLLIRDIDYLKLLYYIVSAVYTTRM